MSAGERRERYAIRRRTGQPVGAADLPAAGRQLADEQIPGVTGAGAVEGEWGRDPAGIPRRSITSGIAARTTRDPDHTASRTIPAPHRCDSNSRLFPLSEAQTSGIG